MKQNQSDSIRVALMNAELRACKAYADEQLMKNKIKENIKKILSKKKEE